MHQLNMAARVTWMQSFLHHVHGVRHVESNSRQLLYGDGISVPCHSCASNSYRSNLG